MMRHMDVDVMGQNLHPAPRGWLQTSLRNEMIQISHGSSRIASVVFTG